MGRIIRAFSLDSVLVFLRGFVPVPPTVVPQISENLPTPTNMPYDERIRNFPQIIAFRIEMVSGRGRDV